MTVEYVQISLAEEIVEAARAFQTWDAISTDMIKHGLDGFLIADSKAQEAEAWLLALSLPRSSDPEKSS